MDGNENVAPKFRALGALVLSPDTAVGATVAIAQANDANESDNLCYEILGGAQGIFEIDSSSSRINKSCVVYLPRQRFRLDCALPTKAGFSDTPVLSIEVEESLVKTPSRTLMSIPAMKKTRQTQF